MEHHVHRAARLGASVLVSEPWYWTNIRLSRPHDPRVRSSAMMCADIRSHLPSLRIRQSSSPKIASTPQAGLNHNSHPCRNSPRPDLPPTDFRIDTLGQGATGVGLGRAPDEWSWVVVTNDWLPDAEVGGGSVVSVAGTRLSCSEAPMRWAPAPTDLPAWSRL